MFKFQTLATLLVTPFLLVGCQSSTTQPAPAPYTLGYSASAAQSQTVATGSSSTLAVNVSGGSTLGNLQLSATVNNSYCTLASSNATTDSSGNASFAVTAGPGGGLGCAITVNLLGVTATRSAVNFNLNIRELQRTLAAPSSNVSVPTTTPTVLNLTNTTAILSVASPHAALGSSNDSFRLQIQGLPPTPAGYSYVLWRSSAAGLTVGLDTFKNASGGAVNLNYTAPAPSNSGSSATVTDNRSSLDRVFVTVEAGAVIPAIPSALVVLDTAGSLFVQSLE